MSLKHQHKHNSFANRGRLGSDLFTPTLRTWLRKLHTEITVTLPHRELHATLESHAIVAPLPPSLSLPPEAALLDNILIRVARLSHTSEPARRALGRSDCNAWQE